MESDNHEGRYAGRKDKKSGTDRKKNPLIFVMAALIFILLVVVFLLSPLKEIIFPSKTAPAVTLVVAESGLSAERVGYQRIMVRALVEGNPEPRVEFNRNDEFGGEGDHHAVLLLAEGETFLLKALATNPLGSAEAELEVFAGITSGTASGRAGPAGPGDSGPAAPGNGEEPDGTDRDGTAPPDGDDDEEDEGETANRPPAISGLTFSTSPLYAGEGFSVTVQAIDPDGDPLSYQWLVDGVVVPGASGNTTTWPNPVAGSYDLLVVVSDGRGGEAEITETVTVSRRAAAVLEYEVGPIASESGHIAKNIVASPDALIFVGDDRFNTMCRGFISFDIGPLAGADINAVELHLRNPVISGDPSLFHQDTQSLTVRVVHWGPGPFALDHYFLMGPFVRFYDNYSSNITLRSVSDEGLPGEILAKELQAAIDEGKNRFQIRLNFPRDSSNNNSANDSVHWEPGNIKLLVFYER